VSTGYDRSRPATDRPRDLSPPLPATLSWSALVAFVVVLAVAFAVLDLPWWIPVLYVVMSVVAFAAYGIDKAAARGARQRISEQTLLMLGLFGGWPGALIAQQLFRHKTRKRSFRRAFWGTVVINVAAISGLVTFSMLNGVTLDFPLGRCYRSGWAEGHLAKEAQSADPLAGVARWWGVVDDTFAATNRGQPTVA
jgi:uncharacterized membrane protein YsdA (DUF1294 family)